jgi:amino acid adenylation domain-containing protein
MTRYSSELMQDSGGASLPIHTGETHHTARQALERFLIAEVANRLELRPQEINVAEPLTCYGMDSLAAIEIAHAVEKNLGKSLPFETLVEGLSIREIVDEYSALLPPATSPGATSRAIKNSRAVREHALSPGQAAMWGIHRRTPLSPAYNIAAAMRVRSELQTPLLQRSLQTIIDRHSAFRTTFKQTGATTVQYIHEQMALAFAHEDASQSDDASLNRQLSEESHKAFDLESGPLFRVQVFSRSVDDHVILMVAHHIISDFWSLAVILKELVQLYSAGLNGKSLTLEEPVQYIDYVEWQEQLLAGQKGESQWQYWSKQLDGDLPELNLPTDHPRRTVPSYRGGCELCILDVATSRGLKRLSAELGVTLYVTLLGLYQVLLHRYSNQEELIVGSPAMGRSRCEWAGVVGYLVNSLPLRARFHDDPTFTSFLRQVRQTVLDALAHQDFPFSTLVERLQPARLAGRSPIFDTLFVFQKPPTVEQQQLAPLSLGIPGTKLTFEGLNCESVALERQAAAFDLTCMMGEVGEAIGVSLKYSSDLFDQDTIKRMLANLQRLAAAVVADPHQRVSSLPLCSASEAATLLAGWNAAEADQWSEACVSELFERQVKLTPEAPAVAYEGEQRTYAELDQQANRLARYLQSLGVGPEVPVAVCTDRGLEMVLSLLAILKAGGAYVPLDPAEPAERLAVMLKQVRPLALLTQKNLAERFADPALRRVYVDEPSFPGEAEQTPAVAHRATGRNLAYVIFTSGSTGIPRGVCVERRQLLNYVRAIIKRADFPAPASFATVSTIAADLGNTMIFPALCTGGCLHIISHDRSLSASAFADYANQHPIDCLKIVPSHLDTLLRGANAAQVLPRQRLIMGGEACSWDLIEKVRLLEPTCAVFNHYGPTETTVGVLTHCVNRHPPAGCSATVPIGRPLSNVQVYLLDRQMQPVPIGVTGELFIGGDCVSRGYYANPLATADRFVPDPFAGERGRRLYRVGDLARFLPDGAIEFLGRTDDQVKIRGYRIEIGEVEEAINQHPLVHRAVVMAVDAPPIGKRLMAYLIADAQQPPEAKELRQFLKQRLPEPMIPSAFTILEKLPLTLNGKVDRQAISKMDGEILSEGDDSAGPSSPVEQALAVIWQQVLGVERVGSTDSFFELGGHSLLATQLISQLQEIFPSETPLLTLFFQDPTVAGLAEAILQGENRMEEIEAIVRLLETVDIQCEV